MWTLLQLTMFFGFMVHQVSSAQNDCGNTSFSGSEGVVTSPNFPLPYPHNISCAYSIDVGRNNSVLLKFLNFDLESPNYRDICTRDWLMITCNETDDENLDFGKRYCGTTLPRTSLRFFNCPVVELMFFADYSINGGGFAIEYTVLENVNLLDNISALDCGDTVFTNSSGLIRLPSNPTGNPASVNCTYTIATNYSSRIWLNILPFQRTQLLDSFANCNRDKIMVGCVSDGETELNPNTSNTYCRSSVNRLLFHSSRIVFSNCRMVKISIRSSDYNYRGSYSLMFTAGVFDESCGTTSFTSPTGVVTSPQFPLPYPHSLNCVYSIDVDRTKAVSLNFLSFTLEGTSNPSAKDDCSYDWITVSCLSDGSLPANPYQNRKYCGVKPGLLTLTFSNCDSLTLNFVTDSSVSHGGFQFRYNVTSAGHTASNTTDVPDERCGNASFTGPTGFITSPQFPLSYPNNLNCVYSIDVDPTKMVVLRFLSFNLEGTSHPSHLDRCNFDWLMISCLSNGSVSRSSMSTYSHRNTKYCGEKATPFILGYSGCESLTLHFVTDSSVTSGGFQLQYTTTTADQSDCGETLFAGSNGVVTSPKYPFSYPHNMSCAYSINVGRNNSVLLKFKNFELEMPNSADNCKDWLMISCNETTKANPNYNRKYCGSIHWVSSLRFVDCPSLLLEFVSDSSISHKGFLIQYTVVDNSNFTDDNSVLDCGASLFTNSPGVINLPRNPTNYLTTVNCTYTISTNQKSYMWLSAYLSPSVQLFQSFQDCDRESLTIGCLSDGETEVNPNTTKVFCRRRTSTAYYYYTSLVFDDCRTLKLSIRSTNYDNRETFRIPFSILRQGEICGNTSFSAPYGLVSSRRLPFQYSKSVNCLYSIDSGHVNSVVLILDRLSFGYSNIRNVSCYSGWLKITCLLNGTSVPHPYADRKLCGPMYSPITARFSACSSVLLNYSSNYISYDIGFSIRYRMGDYDPECGNNSYSGPNGFITSPLFPLSYPHNLNCLYSITDGQRNMISLSFTSFSLEGTSNTTSIDSCSHDWLTVSCLSDISATANISTSRKYCGVKTALRFSFPSCAVVGLNFRSDSSVTYGGFRVRYTVIDTATNPTPEISVSTEIPVTRSGKCEVGCKKSSDGTTCDCSTTQSDCGNTSFSGLEGVVTSPNFPLPYPHNLSCTYSIDVGRNNSVLLKFLNFDLESPNFAGNCTRDWLMITCNEADDENLDFGKRYCGTDLPRTSLRFFNCPVVQLMFFADYSVNGGGFAIEYTVFENVNFADSISALDCGETVFTNSPGVIRLPTNPTDYPASVDCIYTISTHNMSRFSLNIMPFQRTQLLDSFANCNRDKIMIVCVSNRETGLNPNTSNIYCRRSVNILLLHSSRIVFSNCRTVKISIRSSDYNFRGSYSIPFTVTAYDESCGTTSFTGSTGIVTSPGFPLKYAHSLNCIYSIDVDRTKAVSLNFVSFTLEGTSIPSAKDECSYDWITVSCLSDGSVPANPYQNRKYCGVKPGLLTLTFANCDALTLNFVTDSSVSHGGFQFRYNVTSAGHTSTNTTDAPDEGCGNSSFTGPVGLIASPRFPQSYPNNLDCTYSIDVDPTKMVVLRFLSMNIEGTSHPSYLDRCNFDWLMISCLSNASVSRLPYRNRKYCGETTSSLILGYPNCESLTLNFVTDSSMTSGGFQLQYTIRSGDQSDCGDTLFSGSNGVVTSPNYPFLYPHNMSCAYSIDVGRNNSVLLKFEHFNLETPNSADYCLDWLMISCNETTKANPNYNKKYCGSIQWFSSLRFVDCPSLVLEFVSDSSINSSGFVIQYTVVDNSNFTDDNSVLDCGTTLFTNSSGLISLPRNPTNYLATVNCTYTISANQKSYIWLNTYLTPSTHLLQSFQDCSRESLTIGCVSEGETEVKPNTTRIFCGGRTSTANYYTSLVFDDCRTLKLSMRSTNFDNPYTLRIPFSVLGQSEICGNTSFSAPSGVVSSGRLPSHYPKSVNCLYTIDNGHVNSVVLMLYRLNFGYTSIRNGSCYSGWLKISCLLNGTSVPHLYADRKLCDPMYNYYGTTIRFPACSRVLLNYSTIYISSEMGFSIRYRMVDYDAECGNTSFSGPNGFVTSPQFPLSYPHDLNCLYSITGGQKNLISLSFLSFSLEGTSSAYSVDSCSHDWLIVSCLSDKSAAANTSSSRRYCGYKTMPLQFTFPSCEVVGLNFVSDSSVTEGGFKVRYTVIDTESLCGVPVYGPASGVMSFPWNNTDFGVGFDCNYVINATEPSSISLTIWSISLQRLVGRNCQNDWLLITCINGQTGLDHKVSHRTCDNLNASTQLTFPSCAAAKVVYHKESEVTGKTFRIEYTVASHDQKVLTTELPTTSISPTSSVTAKTSCATGCKLSPDATHCECLSATTSTPEMSVSTEIPVTRSGKCEVGCKKSSDGTTCDCSTAVTTQSDNAIVDAQKGSSGSRGSAVGISLTVIFLVAGAICLGAFLLFRRFRKKSRSEMLIQASEIEVDQLDMDDDASKGGSLFRNQDRDTSIYLPLKPLSFSDLEDRSYNNSTQNENEIEPGL